MFFLPCSRYGYCPLCGKNIPVCLGPLMLFLSLLHLVIGSPFPGCDAVSFLFGQLSCACPLPVVTRPSQCGCTQPSAQVGMGRVAHHQTYSGSWAWGILISCCKASRTSLLTWFWIPSSAQLIPEYSSDMPRIPFHVKQESIKKRLLRKKCRPPILSNLWEFVQQSSRKHLAISPTQRKIFARRPCAQAGSLST